MMASASWQAAVASASGRAARGRATASSRRVPRSGWRPASSHASLLGLQHLSRVALGRREPEPQAAGVGLERAVGGKGHLVASPLQPPARAR